MAYLIEENRVLSGRPDSRVGRVMGHYELTQQQVMLRKFQSRLHDAERAPKAMP